MRILMAAQTYRPATNGAAVFTIQLAEGLAQAGHEVLVLMPSSRLRAYGAWCNDVQVRAVTALPLAPLYPDIYVTVAAGRQVGRVIDEFRPDAVHVQDHYPLSRAAIAACRRRGLPVVGTNNFLPENMVPQMPALRRSRGLVERVLWAMVLSAFNRVDVVTAATETSADILRRQGIRRPVRAISCGVDLGRFRPDPGLNRATVRLRHGFDPLRSLFLYVGRLDPEKRLDVLLRAMHRLGRYDVQLGIVGRGSQAQELQALAEELALDGRVVFAGYVPDEELPSLMNCADVFAMPSEAELQCLAALEAMASGRPLLASDARALPELVEEGVNGYLFRAGDVEDAAERMGRLADERPRWPAMGEASLAMARRHSIEETVRRYEALYRGLATGRGAAG